MFDATILRSSPAGLAFARWLLPGDRVGTAECCLRCGARHARPLGPRHRATPGRRGTYQYDANSNRTQLQTYPAGSGGACSTTTTPTTQALSYDEADRLTGSGLQYDVLGRIGSLPGSYAGAGALTSTFGTDDLVRSLQQGSTTTTIDRDPDSRVRSRTTGSQAAIISHYGDDTDEPTRTEQGSIWTKNITDLTGDLAVVQTSGGGLTLELANLHGDVVAEMPNSPTASNPTPFVGADEFGVPRPGAGGPPISTVGTGVKTLTSAATSMTVSKPAGLAANDLLIAQIAAGANATITPPTGFTVVPNGEVDNGTTRYKLYYKVAGTSEPGSYAFSFNQSSLHVGAVTAFRNASTTTPIDDSATASGTGGNLTAPSVTPAVNGTAHLVFGGRDSGDSNGSSIFAFPSPLTEEWERKTGTTVTDRSAGSALRILSGGATTPTGTVTITNETGYATATWGAITIAVKPNGTVEVRNQNTYGYLGAKQRHQTLATGAIEMGARVYVPQIGRFLQTDPIYGGAANPYDYALQQPVNTFDLDGMCVFGLPCPKPVKTAGRAVKRGGSYVASNVVRGAKTVGRGTVGAVKATGRGTVGAVRAVARGTRRVTRAAVPIVVRHSRDVANCTRGALQAFSQARGPWYAVAGAALLGCAAYVRGGR